jgi:CubicO group peptidase (beta-lactamase class C family)
MKKAAVGLLGLVLIVAGAGLYRLSPVASGASGYAAKNLCSGAFVSGFTGDAIMAEALLGASPVLGNVTFTINEEKRRVDAHVFGFFHRRAVFADHTGCVLLTAGQDALSRPGVTRDTEPVVQPFPGGEGLVAGFEELLETAFSEPRTGGPRYTKAIIILHKGRLVAERYAAGVDKDTPLIGWSMSKSITGLTTGLMVGDGLLDVAAPAQVTIWHENPDDLRARITLDQLLRMSSGLAFDETYAIGSDVTYMLSNSGDAGGYAADMPLEAAPDTRWAYSSGTSNIIAGILKRTSGGSLQTHFDYVQTRLFTPLGITSAILETDTEGTFIGSSYSYLNARDWARLGQFCLQNGAWNGVQLLPKDWIAYSTAPTYTNPGNDYGAHFWLNGDPEDESKGRAWPDLPTDAYFMSGFQGQFVAVVPSADLVVVRLGFSSGDDDGVEALIAGAIALVSNSG